EVDGDERKGGHETQREEVERAFPLDAGVDRLQLVREPALHPVPQEETRDEEREGRAQGRGEGDDDGAPEQAEHGAAREGQYRRAGQREAGYGDVEGEVDRRRPDGMDVVVRRYRCALRAEIL